VADVVSFHLSGGIRDRRLFDMEPTSRVPLEAAGGHMQYTTQKIQVARGTVEVAERRVHQQRRKVQKLELEHDPAHDARARLMVMEQSLLAMVRFLKFLERDLAGDEQISIARARTASRIRKSAQVTPSVDSPPAESGFVRLPSE
jgi:hypothetical protein